MGRVCPSYSTKSRIKQSKFGRESHGFKIELVCERERSRQTIGFDHYYLI